MSLLTIVQQACATLSINVPGLVIGNPDPTVTQLLSLAQEAGDDLARDYDWSNLHILSQFTTTGAYPEPNALPSDWQKFTDNSVIWNNSRLWQLNGPVDAQTWQRNTVINSNPVPQIWRILQGDLDIYPNTVGETISFEYISMNWVKLNGGGTSATFASDLDTTLFPERLVRLSLIWRWKDAKGLDFSSSLEKFERAKENDIGSDRAAAPKSLSMPNRGEIPDNYWPGIITVTP
ncbi:hypothetical protein G6M50_38085 [Agrobacterium rhizogenes]|nr:hypothetical protein [Rhizobium rhizogenes]NTJ83601.1 hypothetical protein [Rhizobium rhizogenes]